MGQREETVTNTGGIQHYLGLDQLYGIGTTSCKIKRFKKDLY